jgi:hypothetical protein
MKAGKQQSMAAIPLAKNIALHFYLGKVSMNKDDLLDALEDEREKLIDALEDIPEEAMLEPGVAGEWSVKDILAHLNAWEAELIRLLWHIRQGKRPAFPQVQASEVDERNRVYYEQSRDRPLERILADFEGIRIQTIRRVEAFSDQELTDPARFTWLKGRALWERIAEDSYAHDAEHAADILAWRARRGL